MRVNYHWGGGRHPPPRGWLVPVPNIPRRGPPSLSVSPYLTARAPGRRANNICLAGLVTETGSGERNKVGCRHGPAQLSPPSVPARDHPARDLALSPVHPELPRCRGAAGRARTRLLLRNGATLGAEIRSRDRATAAPAAPSAEQPMAPGRDGGADRRQADVPLAGRRSRGRGPRPACPAPARQPGGAAADAQAAQEARLRAEIAGHRQIALLRRGVPPSPADLSA